ncbi:glycerol-3-phosphate 1-O-acyltransferase PlsY [Novosphingobium resinovorum]|jgi:glycerol-3-phosphate acyltransferase PlsY|uniref:Glycerol-3-phosphate acyltransferase n=1 Tax=Novosphingobium resinovorum TaxID=158500 RepID=A0A031K5Z4_9SPHN|nr:MULTISPECIES: glycerol-3-phosphate 1-O-acyltransferase PlsY [Sphingomonadaceae]AOR75678.1 glycerol-3-phosphate acyltransferase [Novosphingobium resinovorum]EJU13824.1 acyl-phosphate glycerol-3-phosphate acyltransferase [Sphingomonas sp. LH128]EZP84649.1 Lysophosphatidic acid synthase [Novosphingobium resinovorum]MBF7011016.1 glycerol-3-phosphate 1-O-acyltransferase PlsY [Novosphingobium sp. HR1a]WJM29009.1 glycerol-3-phosphate 1-O-acyltransferase PlsY [Novosphingobium resinovorum]
MTWILPLVLGYLLGSVPFGLILTRVTGAGDLRSIGSGNIGATNVLRTGRKGLAAATLLLDLLKGLAAVLIAAQIWPETAPLAALGALLGHCFPVWLRFKGGKGVATAAGVAFGLAWPVGLAYALTWIGLLATVRISSVSGMTAAIVAPLAAFVLGYPQAGLVLTVIAALVLFQHRENIARLRAGTEPRIGGGKKK